MRCTKCNGQKTVTQVVEVRPPLGGRATYTIPCSNCCPDKRAIRATGIPLQMWVLLAMPVSGAGSFTFIAMKGAERLALRTVRQCPANRLPGAWENM